MVHLIAPHGLDPIDPDADRFQIEDRVIAGTTCYRADDAFGSPGLWHPTRALAERDLAAMRAQRRATCPACDGSGYREYKHPVPGITYCTCPKGRAERRRILARDRAEAQAEREAGLPW